MKTARTITFILTVLWVAGCALGWAEENGAGVVGSLPAEVGSEQRPDAIPPVAGPASQFPVASPSPAAVPLRSAANAERAAPDIFLLPDAEGNLRQVLGFRYEDFLQSWQQAMAAPPPSRRLFVIESLRANGLATGSHAVVRLQFEVLALADGWHEVPLKMPSAIMREIGIDDRMDGESVVFDVDQQSYLFWFKGTANETRTLTLEVLVPIARNLKRTSLDLHLPQATVSEISLTVAPADARIETTSGVVQETEPASPSGTTARIAGAVGPVRLEWTTPPPRLEANSTLQVESIGELTVEVDRERVIYHAQLTIESLGGPLERLRIRLPENSRLAELPGNQPFRIVEVSPDDESDESLREVEVVSLEPQSTGWDLRLRTEQLFEAPGDETSFTATGFEVLGAFRQSGNLTLLVDDQLQVYFDPEGNILQVPLSRRGERLTERAPVAQFAYSSKPWSLEVHSVARQRRVNVRPQYEIALDRNEARLNFECEYQFSGATTFAVRVDLRGWELTDDGIESGGAIDPDRFVVTRDGHLIMPLVNPEVGRVRLSFSARKSLQLGNVELPLPEPLGAFVLPGRVQVNSNPALLVSPQFAEMEGIQAATTSTVGSDASRTTGVADGVESTDNRWELVTYLARPLLVMRLSQREQVVYVDAQTRVQLGTESARVMQLFEYQVNYQPVSQLLLQVPNSVWDSRTLTARIGEVEVQLARESSVRDSSMRVDSPVGIVAYLPRPMLNSFRLEISFELPLEDLEAASPESAAPDSDATIGVRSEAVANGAVVSDQSSMVVPLVMPVDVLDANQLVVTSDQPLQVALDPATSGDVWQVSESHRDADHGDVVGRFDAKGTAHEIALVFEGEPMQQDDLVLLEKAWLQSWVVDRRRQDRAVFQFQPLGHNMVIDMPHRLSPSEIEILLDGQSTPFEIIDMQRIVLPVAAKDSRRSRTLELRYHRSEPLQNGAEIRAEFPRPVAQPTMMQAFWQVVLPEGWLVLRSPELMSGEYTVGWRDARWGRHATIVQQELEVWFQASRHLAPSPAATQYVFSSLDAPGDVSVTVVRESWVVVAAALGAFLIGLLAAYTTIARYGAFWAVVGLTLLSLVAIAPEYALLVGQAILLSGAMLLAMLFLRRILEVSEGAKRTSTGGVWSGSTVTTDPWTDRSKDRTDLKDATTASLQATGSSP